MSRADNTTSPKARAPRWCTAETPAPRPAYHQAADAYPGLAVRPWCRLSRLMSHRGLLDDAAALRMADFLADTDTVRADGVIADVPAMITAYRARARVSRQTAWTDLRRLVVRGLVRQVQAAAPGYPARYRLSAPAAMVAESMPGLPSDLAREIFPSQRSAEDGRGRDSERQDEVRAAGCGGLDTSPYTREGSPPPPRAGDPEGPRRPSRFRAGGGTISEDETRQARAVLTASAAEWRAQRARPPGAADMARVEILTALALRHVPAGEVRQLLTWHISRARDLAGVLIWRLGRVVDAARAPARQVPADEDGVRYAAMIAARAGNTPSDARLESISAARAAAEDARRRFLSAA